MPTGTGKTVVIAAACQRVSPKRVLVCAHRGELIWQNANSITRFTDIPVGIEMGENKLYPNCEQQMDFFDTQPKYPQVISATIQTLAAGGDGGGRFTKFLPEDIDYLIIDEAHRTITPSYLKIIKYFKQNPNLKIIGFTATPNRFDGKAMSNVYEDVAYQYDILSAVNDGWLVPPKQHFIKVTSLDFSKIATVKGDFDIKGLAQVMEQEKPIHEIVSSAIELIGTEQAIAFCASVPQSELMCEIFNRYRPGMAVHIDADTSPDDRRARLAMHKAGKVQVLCNVGIATEGYDDANIRYLIMARPTKSAGLYTQMMGRVLRPLQDLVDGWNSAEERKHAIAMSCKPNCQIIDYVGISGKHSIISSIDILGGTLHADVIKKAKKRAEERKTPVTVTDLLEDELERQAKVLKECAKKREGVIAKCEFTMKEINPFRTNPEIEMLKQRGDYQQPTVGQMEFLAKRKINAMGMTRKEAKLAILGVIEKYKKGYCRADWQAIISRGMQKAVQAPAAPAEPKSKEQVIAETRNALRDKFGVKFKAAM